MLISIIFIAELIIAYQLISLIRKMDRKVCDINDCVKEFIPLTDTLMRYIKIQAVTISDKIKSVIGIIKTQQEQTIKKIILFTAVNAVILIFRIKKIKTKKIMRLILAFTDIAADLAILSK